MATKNKKTNKEDTPANYGRWDTFSGTITCTNKDDPVIKARVEKFNAEQAAKAKAKSKAKNKTKK